MQLETHYASLKKDILWLENVIQKRTIAAVLRQKDKVRQSPVSHNTRDGEPDWETILTPPVLAVSEAAQDFYSDCMRNFSSAERLMMVLALCTYVAPEVLDWFSGAEAEVGGKIPDFGEIPSDKLLHFIPSCQTALFLLTGNTMEKRLPALELFKPQHRLFQENILQKPQGDFALYHPVALSHEYLELLTTGKPYYPPFNHTFPARRLTTKQTWEDLILDPDTMGRVEKVKAWIRQRKKLMKEAVFAREIDGFKALFYGPAGTGKTLTANLLGQEMGMEVFRVDLSKIVSKYVGETEKNLAYIFDQAQHKDWILFFDEGEALFGKRSASKSANDRYANQEIAYLLQRIEEHPGVVILATNLRANLDKAFLRRFQAEIYFKIPPPDTRLLLWQKAFDTRFELDKEIELDFVAQKYQITGAGVRNVKHYTAIMALEAGGYFISEKVFKEGLQQELQKELHSVGACKKPNGKGGATS